MNRKKALGPGSVELCHEGLHLLTLFYLRLSAFICVHLRSSFNKA